MSSTSTRELFGGAITVTLPADLIDAADLRQVPDTQELFLYPDSGISVIVEVLECVEAQDVQGIAKLHFEAVAHDNDAEESELLQVVELPAEGGQTPAPIVLDGYQTARKFNSLNPDLIRIILAIYRIPDHNVDLVFSMNVPIKTHIDDAAAEAEQTIATNVIIKSLDAGAVSEDEWQSTKKTFEVAARSLRIVDFGLFA